MYNVEDYTAIAQPEYDVAFWNHMKGRPIVSNAISVGERFDSGAYLLPSSSNNKYENAVDEESIFRKIATVFTGYDGGSTILAADSADVAEFVPEFGSINIKAVKDDFTTISVGRYKLATLLRVPAEFVRDAAFNFEGYIVRRLAKAYAKTEDKSFIVGTGVDEPTGILAETGGAEVGETAPRISYDSVIRLFFSLKPDYRKNAVWLMNDATALALRSLKDSSGAYLWNTANDTILGKPVLICNDMPGADVGAKPIAFGDFSYYWIIKRSHIIVKVLNELFAMTCQIGYLSYEFLDGKLIRPEAVKVMQMAAAE